MFSKIPLTALRAFESVARLGSFKAAGSELAVTPTAISHQIKSLESWLGLRLFERKSMGVSLTPVGQAMHQDCHKAFQLLSECLEAVRPTGRDKCLVVTTTPAFAATWLIPRLDGFHVQNPHLHIAVETSDVPVDLLRDARVDLAIRCSTRDYPSLTQRDLFTEYFGAYGTEDFDAEGTTQPINLVAVRWSTPSPISVSWEIWCDMAGRGDWLERSIFRHYDDEHFALQAVLHGQNAVLASSVLVADLVSSGSLQPICPDVRIQGARYLALCRPGRERSSTLCAFLDWLEKEAQLTREKLAAVDGDLSIR
jgi:LysR family transcriptional regulator, glycine cleavage system transcriptional activator